MEGDTPAAQSTPAAEAAQAEQKAIMTDSNHPVHFAWMRGDKDTIDRHLNPFYAKAAGTTKPIVIGAEGISTGDIADQAQRAAHPAASEAPTEPPQQSLIDETTLTPKQRMELAVAREEFGPDVANRLNEALSAREHILQMPEWMAMFTAWDPFIDQLGDLGEAFVWECLSVVNKYANRANQRRTS
jgi:hypothetical protein